jgi:protein-S-isoprenylcysteine O-methyltransferase Ste14
MWNHWRKRVKGVVEFYGTIGVPILYGVNLWLVANGGNLRLGLFVKLLGLVIGLSGVGLWLISFVNLGDKFGVLPRRQAKVKRGLYKWFPHPMYMGIEMTFLGLSLANESDKGIAFSVLVMLPLLWWRAGFEEKKLV